MGDNKFKLKVQYTRTITYEEEFEVPDDYVKVLEGYNYYELTKKGFKFLKDNLSFTNPVDSDWHYLDLDITEIEILR